MLQCTIVLLCYQLWFTILFPLKHLYHNSVSTTCILSHFTFCTSITFPFQLLDASIAFPFQCHAHLPRACSLLVVVSRQPQLHPLPCFPGSFQRTLLSTGGHIPSNVVSTLLWQGVFHYIKIRHSETKNRLICRHTH